MSSYVCIAACTFSAEEGKRARYYDVNDRMHTPNGDRVPLSNFKKIDAAVVVAPAPTVQGLPETPLDADGNGRVTKAELQEKLAEMNVPTNSRMSLQQLEDLYSQELSKRQTAGAGSLM